MNLESGKLFIDDEALPVGEITVGLRDLPSTNMELVFTCDLDLKWFPSLPVPLHDIDFSYVTRKRRLLVDVPVRNDVHIEGTRVTEMNTVEGEHETTCEIAFQDGDWTYELGSVTWEGWWRALWERLSTKFAMLLGR